ncbi:hypothetical protein UFOVP1374_42 [uncultured Caudovirales phage]|uniref:Uncharacterized protein n=1 Tax=uncultured Caudovirales phage TaxID=2100421 RepID=A0A6J5S2V8_9CAUD|nr:hypothetical protein UFOVP1374_42 [uncultured Caudovirales phage]
MTEQEITQARADVDQLDIEQLRCGVLLQLLHIEALKAERDRLQYEVDAIPAIKEERDKWVERHKACVKCLGEALQDASDSFVERDAVAAAAKLALDALMACGYEETGAHHSFFDADANEAAITALRQAGVR